MQTREEAKALGENLKDVLLRVFMVHEKAIGMLDGTAVQQEHRRLIDGIIETVHKEILPRFAGHEILLNESVRSKRSFEYEIQRLRGRTMALYLASRLASLLQQAKFMEEPANESHIYGFKKDVCNLVQEVIIPQLEKYVNPGDDLYLFTIDRMHQANVDATIECIAETWKTPPELEAAFYGMFGLLIQAEKAKQQGDITRAYSCLLDANHLIGMHEGAKYAMQHLPEVAAKRRAKLNSSKSRIKKDEIKKRAINLFYTLRPAGEGGKPRQWKSANAAMGAVWTELAKGFDAKKPPISEKTILELCQKLHTLDKEGGSLDIRVGVIQVLSDGTETTVPLI